MSKIGGSNLLIPGNFNMRVTKFQMSNQNFYYLGSNENQLFVSKLFRMMILHGNRGEGVLESNQIFDP